MLKRFLRDSAVYGGAAILARGIALFLVPLYTRMISPADYGMVEILMIFGSLVSLTVAFEISQAVARFYPDAATAEAKVAYASTALWFTVAAYTAFGVIGALAAPTLSAWLLESASHTDLVYVALATIWANGLFALVQSQLRWDLKPARYAAASLMLTAVTLAGAVVLVGVLRLGVLGVLAAQLGGNLAGAALAIGFTRASYTGRFEWARCREMLRFSLPLVPSSIAVFVALYVDRIAIRQLMTLGDVGVFGVGYRLASVVGFLLVAVQGSLMPLVYSHYRDPDTPRQLARILRSFVAVALVVCVALSAFAREALTIFATPAYYRAAEVVAFLAPAVVLSNMYIFAPGLSIARRTGIAAAITIFGALLNTALTFTLIPRLGIRGAALATLLSAGATFTAFMLASQRLYYVPHAWKPLGAAGAAALAAVWFSAAPRLAPLPTVLVKAGVLIALTVLFVKLGLIRREELRGGLGLARSWAAGPIVSR